MAEEKAHFYLIHGAEVLAFFSRLGLLDELESGVLSCARCGAVITKTNFRAVTREQGKLAFLCDKAHE